MGATFRKFHTSFWSDSFIEELSVEDRYFYIYLLTNPYTTYCGVYEISIKKISDQTGFTREVVSTVLKRLINDGKIIFDESTKEICIVNWGKYNSSKAGKPMQDALTAEFKAIKNKELLKIVRKKIENENIQKYYDDYLDKIRVDKDVDKSRVDKSSTYHVPSNDTLHESSDIEFSFDEFWKLYDKANGKHKCQNKWKGLSKKDKQEIFDKLPKYIELTPDKKYRKNPLTYLNGKNWNDDLRDLEKKNISTNSDDPYKGYRS